MKYRHELKFQVTFAQLQKIRYRLEPVLAYDIHQKGDFYTVRSLYFDDIYDSCFFENESGVDNRTKYRIRIYNGNPALIHLEKKSKIHGMTKKEKEEMTLEECRRLALEGRMESDGTLAEELGCFMQSRGMKPKCIVEYDRCAMVSGVGNVRITFDMNVRGCSRPELFLDGKSDAFHSVMQSDMHILEIKYDELLPEYILHTMDLHTLHRQSVSKYCLTRNFFVKKFL